MIYYRLFSGYTSHEIGHLITSNVFNALCVTAEIVIFALLGIFLMWLIVDNISKITINSPGGIIIELMISDNIYFPFLLLHSFQYKIIICLH